MSDLNYMDRVQCLPQQKIRCALFRRQWIWMPPLLSGLSMWNIRVGLPMWSFGSLVTLQSENDCGTSKGLSWKASLKILVMNTGYAHINTKPRRLETRKKGGKTSSCKHLQGSTSPLLHCVCLADHCPDLEQHGDWATAVLLLFNICNHANI